MSRRLLWLLGAAWLLAACAPRLALPPPAPTAAGLGELPPPSGAALFVLDPTASWLQLRLYSAGRLAALGHNHLIASRDLRGRVADAPGALVLELELPAATLLVDDPELRAAAGAEFAKQPDPAAIAGTRRNLLGPAVLDAATHPQIRVRAALPTGAARAEVAIRLRGAIHQLPMAVTLRRERGRLIATGQARLRHADLGLTPFSALGGAISVADEMDLSFHLEAGGP